MTYKKLKFAISEMCSVCDGALTKDNLGFRKGDSYLAHFLQFAMERIGWTYKMAISAHKILFPIYSKQLKNVHGIDYIEFPTNESEIKDSESMIITPELLDQLKGWSDEIYERVIGGRKFMVRSLDISQYKLGNRYIQKHLMDSGYCYDYFTGKIYKIEEEIKPEVLTIESLKELFSMIKGREWDTKRGKRLLKTISMPDGFWDDLWKAGYKQELKDIGFSPKKDGYEWFLNWWISLEESEPKIEIVKPKLIDPYDFSQTILYDYQQPHASKIRQALLNHNYALDGSDTGTGKTFVALEVSKALGKKPIVICPKAVIPAWERSIKTIGIESYTVVNYELIKTGKHRVSYKFYSKGVHKGYPKYENVPFKYISVERNTVKGKYQPKWIISWNVPEDSIIIFDEAHRTKNRNTINSQLIIEAKNMGAMILMLSATIGESPLKMYGPSRVLDFWTEPYEFYTKFVSDYDCSKGRFGWEFEGGTGTMKRLHQAIYGAGKGSRMRVKPLIAQGKFPDSQIIAECYNLNGNEKKFREIYQEMLTEMLKIEEGKAKAKSVLSIRQKFRQEAEMLKVPMMVNMSKDLIEEGHSVIIFVNYTDTLRAFCEKLKTDCVIYGGSGSSRVSQYSNEENRLRFQKNESRIIVCNIASGREGIDLHDEKHEFTRIVLITPDDNAQSLKQCLGRAWRAGGTFSQQRIIFAAGTIEEKICESVRNKINNINTLNDGDLAVVDF